MISATAVTKSATVTDKNPAIAPAPPLTLLPAMSSHIPDPIYNEISIAARKGAEFVAVELPEHTEIYIKALHGIGIEKQDIIKAAKAFYLSVVAAKAIQATRLDFEGDFEDLLAAARSDEIRRKNFGRELMGLIEKYTERAYKDGLVDGGVGDATLDDEDMDALNSVILEQRSYVRGFTDTLYEGEGVSDELAGQKPAMWWNKSVYPSYLKGLQSAAKNAYFEWVYGDAEHCNTCLTLNGQVHRMRDYAKRNLLPKSSALECKGYQCQCSLIPRLNAKASGVFPSATKSHEDEAIAS